MRLTTTFADKYTTTYQQHRVMNWVYVRTSITGYDIDTLVRCTNVDDWKITNGVRFTGICEQGSIKPLPFTAFWAYLSSKCSQKWVFQNITFTNLTGRFSSLRHRNLRAVCNGFFNSGYSTSAWCLEGDGSVARGVNIVPIVSNTINATRCELSGIYTILRITQYLV